MNNQSPIFIVGCPRSGMTMLRLILDAHPHISCGRETGFLVEFGRSQDGASTAIDRARVAIWPQELPIPLKGASRFWIGSRLHELGYN
ncbi:MAG: sulfotransferase [Caldilineaceae bacterium]|nr:sulfotransferase [Caldilineaceae bacterium]